MARPATAYLRDALEAIATIEGYTKRGKRAYLREAMQRDAVAARLIQIGQAVKDAQAEGLELARLAPDIPWAAIAGMRDRLAHKYWQHDAEIVWAVVERDLPRLRAAISHILKRGRS